MRQTKFQENPVTDIRFSIRPNYVVQTVIRANAGNYKTRKQIDNEMNLINHQTKGLLSDKSKKKLMQSIDWLVLSAVKKRVYSKKLKRIFRFKVNFITLTIPPQQGAQISEKLLKQVMNTWLTYQRKYNKLNNYVWKVEYHKDGRLHVHIATDTFLHYQTIRDSWNTILKRVNLLEYHYLKYHNYDPNSTDVHSVKKVRKLGAYISKYMSKQNNSDECYTGRVWSCSVKISEALKTTLVVSVDVVGEITKLLYKKMIKYKPIFTQPDLFGKTFMVAELFFLDVKDWISLQGCELFDLFKETILHLIPPNYVAVNNNFQLNFV